jgi:hypothetical protein
MARIFISYRRGDSIGHTGRLFDQLTRYFGTAQVFMDIDTIGPGENFVEVIERTSESCEVFLAVIGRSWLNATDQDGNRRLDESGDFVRLEISHALEKGIRVVPVLVDGAKMPDAKLLPPDLQKFALRNAWEINDKSFRQDVGNLIEALRKMHPTLVPATTLSGIGQRPPLEPKTKPGEGGQSKHSAVNNRVIVFAGIGVVILLAFALLGYLAFFRQTPANSETNNAANPGTNSASATSPGTYDIPSLKANVSGPLLFFLFETGHPVPPPGQRPYATSFHSAQSSGKRIFWEVGLNFQGQLPAPDYQIESVWYRDSQEVFRGTGNFRGSDVTARGYHNRFAWDPPGGKLPAGQYRVDLFIAGRKITSGNFTVQP